MFLTHLHDFSALGSLLLCSLAFPELSLLFSSESSILRRAVLSIHLLIMPTLCDRTLYHLALVPSFL